MAKILVVDDDQGMREFLEILLVREGYKVTSASGGKEAIGLCKKHKFDLAITDLKMPKVDGIDVLKTIKEISPETMVILITAYASGETAVAAMKEGAHDYLEKNLDVEDLCRRGAFAGVGHRNAPERADPDPCDETEYKAVEPRVATVLDRLTHRVSL